MGGYYRPRCWCSAFSLLFMCIEAYYGFVASINISPQGVANVCSGEELEVTCTIDGDLLQWRSATLIPNGVAVQEFGLADDVVNQINSTTLTISRVSTSPLVSTVSLNPVTEALNGTEISCQDLDSPNSTSVTINVINSSVQNLPVNISSQILSEYFKDNGVTVTIEWTEESFHYLYIIIINVMPQPAMEPIISIGSTTAQLNVLYDVEYNVTITAVPLCGRNNVTSTIQLLYETCRDLSTLIMDPMLTFIVYNKSDSGLEGVNITFSCPPGHVLTGPKSTTCMENGEWEPDPKHVNCNEMKVVKDTCTCDDEVLKECDLVTAVVLSSVSTLILASLVYIIIGFLCILCIRKNNCHPFIMNQTAGQPVASPGDIRERNDDVELKDNVAYSALAMQ